MAVAAASSPPARLQASCRGRRLAQSLAGGLLAAATATAGFLLAEHVARAARPQYWAHSCVAVARKARDREARAGCTQQDARDEHPRGLSAVTS